MCALRDYQYISDSKIDVLFPQIPKTFLDGVSAELGFNFGLVSGKVSGHCPSLESRIAKLTVIESYLEKHSLLESSITPQNWVSGKYVARAGFLQGHKGLVLFAGKQSKRAIILAGSESHLVSGSLNPGTDKGWSFMPRLLHSLENYVRQNYDLLDIENGLTHQGNLAEFTANSYIFGGEFTPGAMHTALYDLDQSLPEPSLLMFFVARIFIVGNNLRDESVAVGSPIAVWTE